MRNWIRRHPWITTAIGSGATIAATYYGGPAAAELAGKALPYLCTALGLCG